MLKQFQCCWSTLHSRFVQQCVITSVSNDNLSSERTQCYNEGEISLVNVTYENLLGLFVGGDTSVMIGRVGVCQDGVYAYGSVCDVNWDQKDANVICNSSSFSLDIAGE